MSSKKNPLLQFLLRLVLGAVILFIGIILAMLAGFFGSTNLIPLWWIAFVLIVGWILAPLFDLFNNPTEISSRSSADKIHKAVLGAIVQYRDGQKVEATCPDCDSTIGTYKAGIDSTDGKTIVITRCSCDSCNGEYKVAMKP